MGQDEGGGGDADLRDDGGHPLLVHALVHPLVLEMVRGVSSEGR